MPSLALQVTPLSKTYPARSPVKAVHDVSFQVAEGEIVALLGPNGAGKTTTVKCILNLVRPTGGEVRVYGHDHNDLGRLYRHVAAVLEGNRNIFWRLTPRHNLEVFAAYEGVPPRQAQESIARWLRFFHLEDFHTEVRHLSRGNQQKVAIASALVRGTPLIMLDEPTFGLDVEAKREVVPMIRRLAREEGKTILLTSHQMDVVEALANRVIIIQQGRVIAEGTPTELKRLFDAKTYRLEVRLPESLPHAVQARWRLQEIETTDGRYAFNVVLPDPRRIYRLLDDLEAAGAELIALQPDIPDLEEAYVRLVRGNGNGHAAEATSTSHLAS
jgi:ABC-2 type transport system ATP-binding protein